LDAVCAPILIRAARQLHHSVVRFILSQGRAKWLPEMDGFLRFHKLPTWTRVDVDALLQKLDTKNRGQVERYISGPSEKVLVREKGGSYLNGSQGAPTIDLARQRGLAACQRTKPLCEIIMENDRWVAPGS
jgi:hypothetical protein